jgi:preprotein translocase subunit SecA
VIDGLVEDAIALYDTREAELGEEIMRALERYLLLNIIDQRWREHLYDMDYLREGIHLRGFAQIDPLVAYKNEAYDLFTDLMATIWSDFARMVFNVPVEIEEVGDGNGDGIVPEQTRSAPGAATAAGRVTYSGGAGQPQPSALTAAASGGAGQAATYADEESPAAAPVEQRRVDPDQQIGRNDPCWCGSGLKYKKCHGR